MLRRKSERSFFANGQLEVLFRVVVVKSSGLYFKAAPRAEIKAMLFVCKNSIKEVLALRSSMASITKSGECSLMKFRLSGVNLISSAEGVAFGFMFFMRSRADKVFFWFKVWWVARI